MRKGLLLVFLLFCGSFAYSQTVTYYPWNSLLELSSSPQKPLWLQLRLQGNSVFSSMNTELGAMITLSRKPKAVYYFGPGIQFNLLNGQQDKDLLNGYYLNIGTRVRPSEKYKKVGIAFEISPYAAKAFDIGTWRYLLGVSYSFK
jgi:hypothetical protein